MKLRTFDSQWLTVSLNVSNLKTCYWSEVLVCQCLANLSVAMILCIWYASTGFAQWLCCTIANSTIHTEAQLQFLLLRSLLTIAPVHILCRWDFTALALTKSYALSSMLLANVMFIYVREYQFIVWHKEIVLPRFQVLRGQGTWYIACDFMQLVMHICWHATVYMMAFFPVRCGSSIVDTCTW